MSVTSNITGGRGLPRHAIAAIALVAATYTYFLLFAQFGFLQGIRGLGLGPRSIQLVLGGMAVAGVAASFATPRVIVAFGRGGAMGLGLFICAGAAASAGYAITSGNHSTGHLLIAAVGVGAGLGLSTVALAADLRRLARGRHAGLCVGGGTGLAYFVCNIPAVYGAAPTTKAWAVAVLAALAIVPIAVSRGPTGPELPGSTNRIPDGWRGRSGLAAAVAAFLALVWFDSAAFTTLQLTPEIHDRHWGSETMRWSNGILHACAAIAAGVLLDRGGLRILLALALVLLAFGAWSFGGGGVPGMLAAPAYVTGVSWYSTALAVFAALAPDGAGPRDSAPWRAAWLYGIAGWIGSAAGVGLAEQFGLLPRWALPAAAAVVAASLLWSGRRDPETEART